MTESWKKRLDGWLFSPVDAQWLAVLRMVMAFAYPLFFLTAAAELSPYAPDAIATVYGGILASVFYKPVVLVLCALLACGVRAQWASGRSPHGQWPHFPAARPRVRPLQGGPWFPFPNGRGHGTPHRQSPSSHRRRETPSR